MPFTKKEIQYSVLNVNVVCNVLLCKPRTCMRSKCSFLFTECRVQKCITIQREFSARRPGVSAVAVGQSSRRPQRCPARQRACHQGESREG